MLPSPKFQDQFVGASVDLSEKLIARGLLPDVWFAIKSVIGTWISPVVRVDPMERTGEISTSTGVVFRGASLREAHGVCGITVLGRTGA